MACDERRRQFLLNAAAGLGAVLSASALASILAGCESDTTKPSTTTGQAVDFDVSTEPALANVGGVVKKSFGSNNSGFPVFIVRTGETTFVVLSSRCTHQGCEVGLGSGTKGVCPCHLSEYDLTTGAQTKPPSGSGPTGPLQKFPSSYNPQTKILTITF